MTKPVYLLESLTLWACRQNRETGLPSLIARAGFQERGHRSVRGSCLLLRRVPFLFPRSFF